MPLPVEICPDPERIAAFIDGGLTVAERQDFVLHLADCEACYEVFAEALALQEELEEEEPAEEEPIEEESGEADEGRASPGRNSSPWRTPGPQRPGASKFRFLPIAAGLTGALLGSYFFLASRPGSPPDSGELVAEFQVSEGQEAFERLGWSSPHNLTRGSGGIPYSSEAVYLGARLLDLRLALALEDRQEAASLLAQLGDWRGEIPLQSKAYQEMFRDLAEAGSLAVIADRIGRQEVLLTKATRSDDPVALGLILGRWAEAGRQACRAGDLEFLESQAFARLSRQLLASDLENSSRERVEKISTRLDQSPKQSALGKLQMAFEELLE